MGAPHPSGRREVGHARRWPGGRPRPGRANGHAARRRAAPRRAGQAFRAVAQRAGRTAGRRAGRRRASAVRPLPRGVPGGVPVRGAGRMGCRRHPAPGGAGHAAGLAVLGPAAARERGALPHPLARARPAAAGRAADLRRSRAAGGRPPLLRDRPGRRGRGADRRLRPGARRRGAHPGAGDAVRGDLRRDVARPGRAGRLQRAGPHRRGRLAGGRAGPRRLPLPAAGRVRLQPALRRADGGRPARLRAAAAGAVPGQVRPRRARRSARRGARRGAGSQPERSHRPRRGQDAAQRPRVLPGRGPHELLPALGRRLTQGLPLVQDRPLGHPVRPAPPSAVRDVRVLAARRGAAPACRADRARRHPLVHPPGGLPTRCSG